MTSIFTSPTNGMPWLIRTDFSDESAWGATCEAAAVNAEWPEQTSVADAFSVVNDSEFDALTLDALLGLQPCPYETYLLVDRLTVTHPERPILAVDVDEEPGRSFRLIPSEVRSFTDNMSIANMDLADFADAVDGDGIFRGFGAATEAADTPADDPQDSANPAPVPDDSTVAPTIHLTYGERWPGDANSVPTRLEDLPPMRWEQE